MASLITSSKRRFVLVEFFYKGEVYRVYKGEGEGVGIPVQYFMSDDAPQYFNAFNEIFGCQRKLLCKFHVIQAWGRYLKRLVDSKVKAKEKDRASIVRKILGSNKELSDCKDQHQYRDAFSNLKQVAYGYGLLSYLEYLHLTYFGRK